MKRFQFTLEQLLRVKRQRERLAEMQLVQARADLNAALARVADLEARIDKLANEQAASVGQLTAPSQWAAVAELSARLAQTLRSAEANVLQAQTAFEQAKQERIRRATEVEAITALRHTEWERYQKDCQRHEQRRLDELSMQRWQSNAAPGRPNSPTEQS